jgi:tetratricopeptide (TPR) repeat protein
MRLTIVFLLFIFLSEYTVLAQVKTNSELQKLDSIAFSALENNSPNAQQEAEKLLSASLKVKPSFYRVNAYTILGILNKDKGFYLSALDYYLKALNAADLIHDQPRKSACFNNIGMIFQLQEKHKQAIDYFNQSLEIEKKLKNPLQQSIRFYNIGESYKALKKYDLALTYFNNSLLIEQQEKNTEGIIYAELGISDIYIRIQRFTDASITLDRVQSKIAPNAIEENIMLAKLKGELKLIQGDTDGAMSSFVVAENISEKTGVKTHLLSIYKGQIKVSKAKQDWKGSTLKLEEFVRLNDQINSLHIRNQLDDLSFRNEMTKKDLELELVQEERDLAKQNEISEKQLRVYSQKIIWFVIILIVVFIGLMIVGIKKLTK